MTGIEAMRYGERAYKNKIDRIAAYDEDFIRNLPRDMQEQRELTKSWLRGWDNAKNLSILGF